MATTQILEKKSKQAWKQEMKNLKMDYVVSEGDDSIDNDHPLINEPSTDKSYPLKERTSVDK